MLILLYGCINFKKGLMIFFVYQIFWYSTLLFRVSSLSLNASILLTVGYSFLYLLKKKKYKKCKESFPFRVPFLLIISSYIVSCFFAISGFGTEFARATNYILKDYILIWILWNVLEDEADFKYIFKLITIVILIGCIYGLFEYVTGWNPILEYKVVLSSDTIFTYDSTGLRGYRLTSFFEHPIGAGMTFALYSVFTIYLWVKKRSIPIRKISLFTAFLCIPCVLLTKMRSAILFYILCLIVLISSKAFRRKRFWYLVLLVFLLIPIITYVSSDSLQILSNLFTANKSSEIGGSSLTMRLNQLVAIKEVMKMSPLFGLGETFRNSIVRSSYTDAALGYEGLWFEQAVMHGIYGLIVTIVCIYYTIIKIPKKYKTRQICVFAASYWIVYTFSSIPSFRMFYFWIILFYLIKTSNVYKNK